MNLAPTIWIHWQAICLLFFLFCGLIPETRRGLGFGLLGLSLLLPFIPLGHADLSGWLYAFSGQLSVTSLLLMALFILRKLTNVSLLPQTEQVGLLFSLGALALVFYPMALGLGDLDPYRWGFGQPMLPLIVLLCATLAWWRGRQGSAIMLSAVIWVWLLQVGESNNLWDYLLDIWLALYAVFWTLIKLSARARTLGSRSQG